MSTMKQLLFVVFALVLGTFGYYFGSAASKPKIEQLETSLALAEQNYDKLDLNRPDLASVQRLYCSISGFHDTIIGMRDLTVLAGRLTNIDDEFNLTFQEIYDARIVSEHTVSLAGVTLSDTTKAKDLLEKMLLGHPDPRVLIAFPETDDEEIAQAIVGSHSAYNNYAFTYVQGELIDRQAAVVAEDNNEKMRRALRQIEQYGLKPMFDPTKAPRLAEPRN